MADSLLYKISLTVLPRLFSGLSRLWFGTCKVTVSGEEYLQEVIGYGGGIAAFWHYSIFYLLHHLRSFPAAIMVSASKDGEYIARLIELQGHTPVRGSGNRRGVSALKHLLREVRAGKSAGIVADGSRGPPRKAQAGVILLASRSGRPILPMVWYASKKLVFKSWDRTVMPLPFSRIFFYYGKPLFVPDKIKGVEVDEYRLKLEKRLNFLYDLAVAEAGGQNSKA